MEFKYKCSACGKISMIPFEQMRNGIVCPICGHGARKKSASGTAPAVPVKRASAKSSFLASLNEEQRLAAMYDGSAGSLLVLAGAGCGKTRTMVARAVYLLKEKGANPARMAMVTFTRRAAREIQERLDRELPGQGSAVFVGTFHRFCLNIMHRFPQFFPFQNLKVMDRDDQEQLLTRIRSELRSRAEAAGKDISDGSLPRVRTLASIISFSSNIRKTVDEYLKEHYSADNEELALIKEILSAYKEYKERNEYLDFDDILSLTARRLEEDPELRAIIQNSLDNILVDEMQDTSQVQWDIVRALCPPIKLFCVGDDAQSIYGFRGADFESVHYFCERLPNAVTFSLTENYRSTQQILDVANELLAASPLNYNRKLHSAAGLKGERPKYLHYYDEAAEAQAVFASIKMKLMAGIPPKEIMVLLRAAYCGRFLEYELNNGRIPYRMVGGVGFMQAAHVKDVFSTFEALATMRNEMAWLRFLTMLPGIGMVSATRILEPIMQYNDRKSGLDYVAAKLESRIGSGRGTTKKRSEDDAILSETARFIRSMAGNVTSPAPFLKDIIKFYRDSDIMTRKYTDWRERCKDLDSLLKIAENFDNVPEFLEAFKLDPNAENKDNDEDKKITLITVHSAKGTEADICYVMRVQPGVFPSSKAEKASEIEEERRILYVAVTRARKELYLTRTTKSSFYQDGSYDFMDGEISYYLDSNVGRNRY